MFSNTNLFGERFQKSILIILFLSLTVAVIITWLTPATGFEASIYTSTPLVLWIVLLSGEFFGICLIVLSLSSPAYSRRNLWKIALLFIFLGYTIMQSLYIIRGYYAWCMGGDPASHLGWINIILQTGHTPQGLVYPAMHILTSEISLLTSISPFSLHKIIPVFFGLLCVVFTYLFVRTLTSNPVIPVIAGGIISCPFVFNLYTNLAPNGLADMYLPVAFFILFKYLQRDNAGWGILFCIILILFPVFHPLPAVVIGIVLLTLWIAPALRDVWYGFRENNHNYFDLIRKNMNGKVVIPALILFIWFIYWYSSFSLWGETLADIIITINSEGRGPSSLTSLTSQIQYAQNYGYSVTEIFLKTWGGAFLVSVLSVISFPFIWETVSQEQKKENIFSLYGPWAIFCSIIPLLYLFDLSFGPLRFMSYISILGAIFVSVLVSFLIIKCRDINSRAISGSISIIVIVLLMTLFLSGVSSVYPSPMSFAMTAQNTQSEILGMTYFFEYRNVSIPVVGVSSSIYRYKALLLSEEQGARQNIPDYELVDHPPWHFGYDQYPSIASSYDRETDLIIQKRDQVIYIDYYPDMQKYRFYPDDFKRIKNDPGANLVYSNGEFAFLTVMGQSQGAVV